MRNSFRDLVVWQESFRLATTVCEVIRGLGPSDRIDFGSRIMRASISVPSSIAEGCARTTPQDQKRFYVYAKGSPNELETQIEIAGALGLIAEEDQIGIRTLIVSARRALSGLIRSTQRGASSKDTDKQQAEN